MCREKGDNSMRHWLWRFADLTSVAFIVEGKDYKAGAGSANHGREAHHHWHQDL